MRIDRLLPSTQVGEWVGPSSFMSVPNRMISWEYADSLASIVGFTQYGSSFTSDGSKTNWSNGTPSYLASPYIINQSAASFYVCADIMINGWSNPDSHVGVGFDEVPHVNGHYFVQARLSGGSQTASILADTVAWRQNTAYTFSNSQWYRVGQRWNQQAGMVYSYINGIPQGSYSVGSLSRSGLRPTIHCYGGAASYSIKNLRLWSGTESQNPPLF